MKRARRHLLAMIAGPLIAGCGQTHFPAAVDTTSNAVANIRDSTSLDAQQKRERLREFGLSEVVINGLLRDERTGNQYGGTLRTAFDKVVAGAYATLTPDEIQLYGDASATRTYSDAEAQAVSDLFVAQSINTADDLADYLDNPANELDAEIDADDLRSIFVDLDPDSLLDQIP